MARRSRLSPKELSKNGNNGQIANGSDLMIPLELISIQEILEMRNRLLCNLCPRCVRRLQFDLKENKQDVCPECGAWSYKDTMLIMRRAAQEAQEVGSC